MLQNQGNMPWWIADEKLHVVSANKEYFDKTVEGFKNITFVTFTTDGGSS